jgi:hypothetical protein
VRESSAVVSTSLSTREFTKRCPVHVPYVAAISVTLHTWWNISGSTIRRKPMSMVNVGWPMLNIKEFLSEKSPIHVKNVEKTSG